MIGEALRLIRVFHDKTSKGLAAELGISASYLSEIEHSRKRPSLDLIAEYAKVFRTTPAVILFFAEGLGEESSQSGDVPKARTRLLRFLRALERFSPPDEE